MLFDADGLQRLGAGCQFGTIQPMEDSSSERIPSVDDAAGVDVRPDDRSAYYVTATGVMVEIVHVDCVLDNQVICGDHLQDLETR